MKKNLLRIVVISAVVLFAACVGNKAPKINALADVQGKVVGMVSSGITNQGVEAMISGLIGGAPKEVVYFNRANDLLTALLSGKIDAFPAHNFSLDYLVKRNPKLKLIPVENVAIEGGVIMAVRVEDMPLKLKLDSTITMMKANGLTKTFEDEWITNLPAENEPASKEIVKIEGAPTYYVGVSGDFAPLDYIAADGRPAGYNVAILSEISKILKVNFEFVSLENQARFTALSSKKIDIIFCHFESSNTSYFDDLKSQNWVGTVPYFNYKGGSFIVLK